MIFSTMITTDEDKKNSIIHIYKRINKMVFIFLKKKKKNKKKKKKTKNNRKKIFFNLQSF